MKIAEATNTTPVWLATGEGPKDAAAGAEVAGVAEPTTPVYTSTGGHTV